MNDKHESLDLVLDNIDSYEVLNPKDPTEKESKFKEIFEKIVNDRVRVKFFENSPALFIFQCTDDEGKDIPLVLKVVDPTDPTSADEIEVSHKKHVQLLGPEFVEDMTRITITNDKIINVIKKKMEAWSYYYPDIYKAVKDADKIEVFVQDQRALKGGFPLYNYILIKNDSMPENIRKDLITFLERVAAGINEGYVFDFPPFPHEIPKYLNNNTTDIGPANVIVDDEGYLLLIAVLFGQKKKEILDRKQ